MPSQDNQMIIKLYINHNTLLAKHHLKAESLRATSHFTSKLGQHRTEFSTKL